MGIYNMFMKTVGDLKKYISGKNPDMNKHELRDHLAEMPSSDGKTNQLSRASIPLLRYLFGISEDRRYHTVDTNSKFHRTNKLHTVPNKKGDKPVYTLEQAAERISFNEKDREAGIKKGISILKRMMVEDGLETYREGDQIYVNRKVINSLVARGRYENLDQDVEINLSDYFPKNKSLESVVA